MITLVLGSLRAVLLEIDEGAFERRRPGAPYTLHPRNSTPDHTWAVGEGVVLRR
jgi:hypothetical protein